MLTLKNNRITDETGTLIKEKDLISAFNKSADNDLCNGDEKTRAKFYNSSIPLYPYMEGFIKHITLMRDASYREDMKQLKDVCEYAMTTTSSKDEPVLYARLYGLCMVYFVQAKDTESSMECLIYVKDHVLEDHYHTEADESVINAIGDGLFYTLRDELKFLYNRGAYYTKINQQPHFLGEKTDSMYITVTGKYAGYILRCLNQKLSESDLSYVKTLDSLYKKYEKATDEEKGKALIKLCTEDSGRDDGVFNETWLQLAHHASLKLLKFGGYNLTEKLYHREDMEFTPEQEKKYRKLMVTVFTVMALKYLIIPAAIIIGAVKLFPLIKEKASEMTMTQWLIFAAVVIVVSIVIFILRSPAHGESTGNFFDSTEPRTKTKVIIEHHHHYDQGMSDFVKGFASNVYHSGKW